MTLRRQNQSQDLSIVSQNCGARYYDFIELGVLRVWRIAAPVLLPPVLLPLIQWKKERPQFLILNENAVSHICFTKDIDTEFPTSSQTNAWFGKAELCYA